METRHAVVCLWLTLYTCYFNFWCKIYFKYRHNRYQIIRTLSVMFFQLGFAFLIPELLAFFHPDTPIFAKDLKNMCRLIITFLNHGTQKYA